MIYIAKNVKVNLRTNSQHLS